MSDPEQDDRAGFDRRSLKEQRLGAGFVPLKMANLFGWPQFILDQLPRLDSSHHQDPVLDELKAAVADHPDDRDARLNLAVTLAQYGFADEAEREARQVAERWPDEADGRYLLGNLLADRGEEREAEEHLRRAVELDPESPPPSFYLAEFLQARGRVEEALEYYRRAVGGREVMPCAFLTLEEVLTSLGRETEALRVNDDLLARGGADAQALLSRGRHLLRLQRTAEAREILGRLAGMRLEEAEAREAQEMAAELEAEKRSGGPEK